MIRNRRPRLAAIAVALLVLLLALPLGAPRADQNPLPAATAPLPLLPWRLAGQRPHDPTSFTQGLLVAGDLVYESTGLQGHSALLRVRAADGTLLHRAELPPQLFAEGLALADGVLVQLTWKAGQALRYRAADLQPLPGWRYDGEGWGLTHDGLHFIMSDGSARLVWRDPAGFQPVRAVDVQLPDGQPLPRLNELEWIGGRVWANVWLTSWIAVIRPADGRVVAALDLSALARRERHGPDAVLNGIAWDGAYRQLWITGKNWKFYYLLDVDITALAGAG